MCARGRPDDVAHARCRDVMFLVLAWTTPGTTRCAHHLSRAAPQPTSRGVCTSTQTPSCQRLPGASVLHRGHVRHHGGGARLQEERPPPGAGAHQPPRAPLFCDLCPPGAGWSSAGASSSGYGDEVLPNALPAVAAGAAPRVFRHRLPGERARRRWEPASASGSAARANDSTSRRSSRRRPPMMTPCPACLHPTCTHRPGSPPRTARSAGSARPVSSCRCMPSSARARRVFRLPNRQFLRRQSCESLPYSTAQHSTAPAICALRSHLARAAPRPLEPKQTGPADRGGD